MNIPRETTVRHLIGQYIFRNPGVTIDAICEAFLGRRRNFIADSVRAMAEAGLLLESAGGYVCCVRYRQHFEQLAVAEQEKPEVLQAPYRSTFKEYKPAPLMTREPIREMSFVTLSSNVPAFKN